MSVLTREWEIENRKMTEEGENQDSLPGKKKSCLYNAQMYVCVLGFDVYLWSAGWDEIHTCWRFSSQTLRNLSPPHFGLSLAVRFSGILFPPLCSFCFLSPTFMLIYFSLLHWVLRQILFPQRCDLSLFITSYTFWSFSLLTLFLSHYYFLPRSHTRLSCDSVCCPTAFIHPITITE